MRRYQTLLLAVASFSLGAYIWKVQNMGLFARASRPPLPVATVTGQAKDLGTPSVVHVADERITQDEIDWEYSLLTDGVFDKESLTPIPDLGARYHDELNPLRRSLVSSVIERKALYALVKRDSSFDVLDPARYTSCMTAWQQAIQSQPFAGAPKSNRDRLKTRLCERGLVEQYLKERLFAGIQVSHEEVVEYYKNHAGDFKLPERVTIRHILMGSEQAARKCRALVNAQNFEALARQQSLAPEGITGGKLGPFGKGRMPAVFEIAFHLQPGGISEVLKSDYGYHLIMLLQHIPKQQLGLEAAQPKISAIIRRQKEEQLYSQWVEKALATIDISTATVTW